MLLSARRFKRGTQEQSLGAQASCLLTSPLLRVVTNQLKDFRFHSDFQSTETLFECKAIIIIVHRIRESV